MSSNTSTCQSQRHMRQFLADLVETFRDDVERVDMTSTILVINCFMQNPRPTPDAFDAIACRHRLQATTTGVMMTDFTDASPFVARTERLGGVCNVHMAGGHLDDNEIVAVFDTPGAAYRFVTGTDCG